jgi:hypothetical protein
MAVAAPGVGQIPTGGSLVSVAVVVFGPRSAGSPSQLAICVKCVGVSALADEYAMPNVLSVATWPLNHGD